MRLLHAGLMFGPAMLGLLADFTSVQTALVANAAVMVAAVAFFTFTAREARHLRNGGGMAAVARA